MTNIGSSTSYWQASADSGASWLTVSPAQGTLSPGQAGQITINSNDVGLNPGAYTAHVTIMPTDASGNPTGTVRTFTVSLNVLPPCSLAVSPSRLSFSASLLQPNPPGQNIILKTSGGCSYPVSWSVSADDGGAGWLQVSPSNGTENGQGSTITVNVRTRGMLLSSYRGQITISAIDSSGSLIENGSQSVSVSLTVIG